MSPDAGFFGAISSNDSSMADRFLDLVSFSSLDDVVGVELWADDAEVLVLLSVSLLSVSVPVVDGCLDELTENISFTLHLKIHHLHLGQQNH